MLDHADTDFLESLLNYQFKTPELLRLALTHRSYGTPNNERLEFLGDAILGSIVAKHLYQRHDTVQEGELTQKRSNIVNGRSLAVIARRLNLPALLLLGKGERREQLSEAILEDALEALVGAVFLDAGFDKCEKVFSHVLQAELEQVDLPAQKDPKTQLQEFMQANKKSLPRYVLESEQGPDHDKHFVVKACVESPAVSAIGEGGSRKRAEQQAAKNLLNSLKKHHSE